MRSAPPSMAASKTFREPPTLISWLLEPPPMIANARWTTTSAPFTASRTLALSWTSPWRYSVFFQRWLAGSNGRRAMPTIFFTRRDRSSAETSAIPRSPVGPVTATVSPSSAMAARLYQRDVLAAAQLVELVRLDGVVAEAAVHDVAAAVGGVDAVVAGARRD